MKAPKKKPQTVASVTGLSKEHTSQTIIPSAVEKDKAFATMAAEFDLAGHALMRNERGGLFTMRWGQIKPLADLGEAKRFLAQIGGEHDF